MTGTRRIGLLWSRFTLRHWRQSPRTSVMLVCLLALGVGAFLSVRLANRAAVAGFAMYTDSVVGESDFVVRSNAGDLPVGVLSELREAVDPLAVGLFPIVEAYAFDAEGEERFTLLGVDLVAVQNALYLAGERALERADAARKAGSEAKRVPVGSTLAKPGHVVVSEALAEERGLKEGDTMPVVIGDRAVDLTVAWIAPETDLAPSRPRELLVTDLPGLQVISGRTGRIDRVEIRVAEGVGLETVQERLEAVARGERGTSTLKSKISDDGKAGAFAAGERKTEAGKRGSEHGYWTLETPESQRETGATMTRAFRLNLTILSGLALLVGVYLIFQALEAAVVRRRPEIGVLRSLGVRPRDIRRSWLLESLTLGLAGSLLGVLLGWLGAQVAVRAVATTVNLLYFQSTTEAASLHAGEVLVAVLMGLGASVLAGWLPARDAARTPPAQVMQRGTWSEGLVGLRKPWWGVALVIVGGLLCFVPGMPLEGGGRFPVAGYVAAVLWVFGGTMLAGLLFAPVGNFVRRVRPGSAVATYAGSRLARPSGRHRMTVAGLLLAVGMAAGMGILIHSFDTTMRGWIGNLLKADLYVSTAGMRSVTSQSLISEKTWKGLLNDPDVERGEVGRMERIWLDGRPTYLNGVRLERADVIQNMMWVEEPDAGLDWRTPGLALASECFGERFGKGKGDTLVVPTPSGSRELLLAGIYADYGNEHGSIAVEGQRMAEWFDDNRATSAALTMKKDVDVSTVASRMRRANPGLQIRETSELRKEVLAVFRQTFSITYALKGIGVAVAVLGLGLALFSLLVERRRELQTLKRMGLSRGKIALAAAVEGAGIAVVGTVAGLLLSVALGALLVYVVNKQSFGWTLQFGLAPGSMAVLAGLVIGASFVVSFLVGRWGATLPSDGEE